MKIVVDELPICPSDCMFCTPNEKCLLANIIYGGCFECDLSEHNCPYLTTQYQGCCNEE